MCPWCSCNEIFTAPSILHIFLVTVAQKDKINAIEFSRLASPEDNKWSLVVAQAWMEIRRRGSTGQMVLTKPDTGGEQLLQHTHSHSVQSEWAECKTWHLLGSQLPVSSACHATQEHDKPQSSATAPCMNAHAAAAQRHPAQLRYPTVLFCKGGLPSSQGYSWRASNGEILVDIKRDIRI